MGGLSQQVHGAAKQPGHDVGGCGHGTPCSAIARATEEGTSRPRTHVQIKGELQVFGKRGSNGTRSNSVVRGGWDSSRLRHPFRLRCGREGGGGEGKKRGKRGEREGDGIRLIGVIRSGTWGRSPLRVGGGRPCPRSVNAVAKREVRGVRKE